MMYHLFRDYRAIYKLDLKVKYVKIMGAYNPSEPLSHLIENLEKGWEIARPGG